jgi:hypothetical protein
MDQPASALYPLFMTNSPLIFWNATTEPGGDTTQFEDYTGVDCVVSFCMFGDCVFDGPDVLEYIVGTSAALPSPECNPMTSMLPKSWT